jgi:hypothetical protein
MSTRLDLEALVNEVCWESLVERFPEFAQALRRLVAKGHNTDWINHVLTELGVKDLDGQTVVSATRHLKRLEKLGG